MAVIGIDIGGTRVKFGLIVDKELVLSKCLDIDDNSSLLRLLPMLKAEINEILKNVTDQKLRGIGIAFPSVVNFDDTKVLSKFVKYQDACEIDIKEWVKNNWAVPVIIENDARAALIGEWAYGAAKGHKHVVMITLGTGIGTAVMMDGKLVRGKHYMAGNLGGHMIVNIQGAQCSCGEKGCLESEASSWALPNKVKQHPLFNKSKLKEEQIIDFKSVFSIAEIGDQVAMDLRNHCIDSWSLGILNLAFAYDPELIVVGGGVMNSKDIILPYIQERINRNSWLTKDSIKVVSAREPDWAGVLGMATLLAMHT